MSCCTDDPCTRCQARIDAAEDARAGHYWGWTTRELDEAADREADRWAGMA